MRDMDLLPTARLIWINTYSLEFVRRARGQQTGSLTWVNVRNRSGSVVETLLLFLDTRLRLDLWYLARNSDGVTCWSPDAHHARHAVH